jgi:hypothetical protein
MFPAVGLAHAAVAAALWLRRGGPPATAGPPADGGDPAAPSAAHPQATEIERLSSCAPLFVPHPQPPPPLDVTPCVWVASAAALAAAATELAGARRLALDTEHHSAHSYSGTTCLLQLSTGGLPVSVRRWARNATHFSFWRSLPLPCT